jgi:mannose-6-phosphate isomerase-like protein (cupin superfamily)
MNPPGDSAGEVICADEALARLPETLKQRFAELFQHGTLSVEIYAPRGIDRQMPHTRDEVYVVIRGNGEFVYGQRRRAVGPGDFLFVPANMEHRFENFSDDLSVWVFFFGPQGGEGRFA